MEEIVKPNLIERYGISEEVVKTIMKNYTPKESGHIIRKYDLYNASDKMLGFLSDYLKLHVQLMSQDNQNKSVIFFIKAISKSNQAKAKMVKEMNLFVKELTFYSEIKSKMNVPGINPWSANLVASLKEAMVFEDLNALGYKSLNKFKTFDKDHTLQALRTLARFHAASLLYEEGKSKELNRKYSINEEHEDDLNKGGYRKTDPWFVQCMNGALETVKRYSKYNDDENMQMIQEKWKRVWNAALDLSDFSLKYRNVICHRDLWNNNILFRHRKVGNDLITDDCVLVDFQAVRCQPPAGDVMLLLYCNLDTDFRKENTKMFLYFYYQELKTIIKNKGYSIDNILTVEEFMESCEQQRLWALIVSACLVPQFWIDDELTSKIFCNTTEFDEIMTKDKASFIKKMIEQDINYKEKVMTIFEEIIQRYCLENEIKNESQIF